MEAQGSEVERNERVASAGVGLFFAAFLMLLSAEVAFADETGFELFFGCFWGTVFLCAGVAGVVSACKHRDRGMFAEVAVLWSGPLSWVCTRAAFKYNSAFTWLSASVAGALFLLAVVYAGAVARKHRTLLLGAIVGVYACGMWIVGPNARSRQQCSLRFGALAAQFCDPYRYALEEYLSDPSAEGWVDRDLKGKRLVWCCYDEGTKDLQVLAPHWAGQIGGCAFARRPQEADFVVVQYNLPGHEPRPMLLMAFHVRTGRLKATRLFPRSIERRKDLVIPGPGGGIRYVDEIGPFGEGYDYYSELRTPRKAVTQWLRSVVLDRP